MNQHKDIRGDVIRWFTEQTRNHYNSIENGGPALLTQEQLSAYHTAVCAALPVQVFDKKEREDKKGLPMSWNTEQMAALAQWA